MDLREKDGKGKGAANRHPWELSRTGRVLGVLAGYLDRKSENSGRRYVNIGAGDLYFDNRLLRKYEGDRAYAVDLEYDEQVPDYPRVEKFHYLEEVPGEMDYAIMMDSLEYMPDDAAYLKALSGKVKEGGYLFFTLPALQSVFSEHDRIVGNLRRYNVRGFRKLAAAVPGLEVVECQYFYTCLLLIRYLQVRLHLRIDRERKVTSGWKYSERNPLTRCMVWFLNIDFAVNRALSKIGIRLPGLSLLVVCRKEKP